MSFFEIRKFGLLFTHLCGTSIPNAIEYEGKIIAMTMGSRMSEAMFDVQFEKALEGYDGAYPTINQAFAAHLREKYPELKWLNREDDMGLEGLRKAKLSYCPDHMIEKNWACLLEDGCEY